MTLSKAASAGSVKWGSSLSNVSALDQGKETISHDLLVGVPVLYYLCGRIFWSTSVVALVPYQVGHVKKLQTLGRGIR